MLLLLLGGGWSEGPAQARRSQVLLDALYSSHYQWRGVPRVEQASAQLAATGAIGLGQAEHLSLSIWSLLELSGPGTGDFSVTGDGWTFAELDFSIQYSTRSGGLDVTAGVMHYRLNNSEPLSTLPPDFNTTEVFGSVSLREGWLRGLGFTPTLRAWYDFHRIDGAFTELELAFAAPVLPVDDPVAGLQLAARMGASLGQKAEAGNPGYFTRDGTIYWEGVASATAGISWLRVIASYHRLVGIDPVAESADPLSNERRSSWGWLEMALSVRFPGGVW